MIFFIKSIDLFEKDCIIEEIVFLVFVGFKLKFIKMLFKEIEVYDIIYVFCYYIYIEKGENLLIVI